MLTFTYETKFSEKLNMNFIYWKATWNGRHDDQEDYRECDTSPHPFSHTRDYKDEALVSESFELFEVGDVVADNPATRSLCEMLSNQKDMKKWSGYTDPYWYTCNLIGVLSDLWD